MATTARITFADADALQAFVDAAVAKAIAQQPKAASPAKAFPFAPINACTVEPSCGRTDIKTAARTGSHGADGHSATGGMNAPSKAKK